MAMEYDWIEFKLNDALAGTLVGFKQSKTYDLSYTGELKGPGPIYKLAIGGYNLKVDQTGVVKEVTPSTDLSSKWVDKALQMVRTLMDTDSAVGSSVTRSSGSSGEGHSATAVLSTMEPRDHFAMNVLNAMLVHMESPEAKDDATMLKYSRAAYRWAQAMMIAAADSREGTSESTTPSTSVDVKSDDLQSNTEKILFNLNESIKDMKNQSTTNTTTLVNKLGETLKIDNPKDEKFDVEGGGGGASLNRDDINDADKAITDFLIYNTEAGKAPMRATLANTITKILSSLDATQKQTLYDSIKDKMQADFDAKGAADQALADAKKYTDEEIAKKHPA